MPVIAGWDQPFVSRVGHAADPAPAPVCTAIERAPTLVRRTAKEGPGARRIRITWANDKDRCRGMEIHAICGRIARLGQSLAHQIRHLATWRVEHLAEGRSDRLSIRCRAVLADLPFARDSRD